MERNCKRYLKRAILLSFGLTTYLFVISIHKLSTLKNEIAVIGSTDHEDRQMPELPCNYLTFPKAFGRLGNEMFRIAALYGLAKTNKKRPFLSYDLKANRIFNLSIKYEPNISLNSFFLDKEKRHGFSKFSEKSTRLDCDRNFTFDGFRQTYKYFDQFREEIKREFTFRNRTADKCDRGLRRALTILMNETYEWRTLASRCYVVGAHMRRGDIAVNVTEHSPYIAAESEYLYKAIDYFETRFGPRYNGCVLFLVFGDTHRWNVENAPNKTNVFVMPKNTAGTDLCILSRCNATIMSTGTYSWWAAYLAGGPATYMINQYRPTSTYYQHFHKDNYIHPKWDWHPL